MFKRVFANISKTRMNLSQEPNDSAIQLAKTASKSCSTRKTIVVSQKQSVVYTSKQISKLNLKRLRIERFHTDVYTGSL